MNKRQASLLAVASLAGISSALASADYGPAVSRMITACTKWYTTGYGKRFCVVHDMEGYYLSSISYMSRCDVSVSVHYAANGLKDSGSDAPAGEISQLVSEANYAWHAGCWNRYSVACEHEGFASNPAWYTEAMYQSSALLFRHFCDKFGIAKDRNHVVAHGQKLVPGWSAWASANLGIDPNCNSHTDPGPYWDWNHYMALLQGTQNPPYYFDSNAEGWNIGNAMSGFAWTDCCGWPGIIYADQTGNDAFYVSPDTSYTGGAEASVNVSVFPQSGTTASHNMQLFFRTAAENSFSADKASPIVLYNAQNNWVRINLDVNQVWPKYFNQTVTGLRLDLDNSNTSTRWIVNHIITQGSLRWRFDGDAQGWTSGNSLAPLTWTACCGWPGIVYADQTGNDPQFLSSGGWNMLGGINDYIRVRVYPQSGSTANHDLQIFYSTAGENFFSEPKSMTVYYTAKDGWADLSFPVGQLGSWNSDFITRIRLDPDQSNHGNRWIIDSVTVEHATSPVSTPTPTIGAQPTAQTAGVGGSATFTVFPNGVAPFTYQWRKNGANVAGGTTQNLALSNVQLVDAGFYDVVIGNAGGGVTSAKAQLVVSSPPFAVGTGTGLQGEYYDNLDFTNLKLTRTDATVNFNWGTGSPDASIANTTYSVRWSGQVQPRYSQTYTFYTTTDDGLRLWVNGVQLVNKWVDQGPTEWSGTINLVAGQNYSIQMDYYQNTGPASAVLAWSSASEPKAVIPQTQLYISSPPNIVAQPQNQSLNAGYNATFSVSASGAPPLTYQWQKDSAPLAGATGTSLTITGVDSGDQGLYSVLVSNSFGFAASSNATLTVSNSPPSITSQPTGLAVIAGTNVTFSVGTAGAIPMTWQWQLNGTNIPGATQSSLARNGVTPVDAGSYRVGVTNEFGGVLSSNALLTVFALPQITGQPGAQSVNAGANATFTVTATGASPLTYQWRLNGAGIAGATASSYTRTNVQSATVGLYSVVVVNPYGSVTSSEAGLTLNAVIVFSDDFEAGNLNNWTIAPSPATTLANSTGQNHTGGGSHSAQLDITTDKMYHNLGMELEGHARLTFYGYDDTANNVNSGQTRWFGEVRGYSGAGYADGGVQQVFAIGRYGVGFGTGTGSLATQVVNTSNYVARVLSGANTGFLNLSVLRSVGWHQFIIERAADGTTINFYVDGVLAGSVAAANNITWDTAAMGSIASGSTAGNSYFDDFKVEYFDPPAILSVSGNQMVAVGGNAVISVSATNNALTYQWRRNGQNVANGGGISGATSPVLTINNVQGANAGTYTVAVGNGAGVTVSGASILSVPPAIVMAPASQTNVAGGLVTFLVMADGQSALSYRWKKNGVPLSDGANISGAQTPSLTVSSIDDPDMAGYSVAVTNAAGGAVSPEAQLVVIHAPAISLHPQSQAVAAGVNVTFTGGASGSAPLLYQWLFNGSPIPGATGTSYTRNGVQATNNGLYVLTATNAAGGAASNPADLTVNTPPGLGTLADKTIHAGTTVHAVASASDTDVPAQVLTFSLDAAPAGASIDGNTGNFTWTSSAGDAGTTNLVTIRITDSGIPPLNATASFSIRVVATPLIANATVSSNTITLTWDSIAGQTYRIQSRFSLDDTDWDDVTDIQATDTSATFMDAMTDENGLIQQRYYRIMVVE